MNAFRCQNESNNFIIFRKLKDFPWIFLCLLLFLEVLLYLASSANCCCVFYGQTSLFNNIVYLWFLWLKFYCNSLKERRKQCLLHHIETSSQKPIWKQSDQDLFVKHKCLRQQQISKELFQNKVHAQDCKVIDFAVNWKSFISRECIPKIESLFITTEKLWPAL